MEVTNRFITIKKSIDGFPQESDFEIKTEKISLSKQLVIAKNLYVSIDPYQLNRMKSESSTHAAGFSAAILPGQAIDAYGVGRVVESEKADFQKGDLVVGALSWGDYTILKEGALINKLDPMGMPLAHHVGTLGFSGLTAYGGFFDICKPKKGETIFVSAASGSVGCSVGQFAKLFGCYVVGCSVDLLKNELGFDDAFNYKEETDINSALKRYFPNGIDMYFDNVGGEMLEAAIANMNAFGRIAACGVISEYTGVSKRAAPNMVDVIYKRLKIQGFLAYDYNQLYPDFLSTTVEHLQTGKMKALTDISYGLESVPSAFVGLFRGDNIGKKVVQIADE